MLARRLTTILPVTRLAEALETSGVHRVARLTGGRTAVVTTRPFRAPHHTISDVGVIGGGQLPTPGEVSLAHHGLVLLDERPACKRQVLEVWRQSVEESITRRQSPGHRWYLDFSRARSAGPVSLGWRCRMPVLRSTHLPTIAWLAR
jgi:predicted ATPase with chaperone activity